MEEKVVVCLRTQVKCFKKVPSGSLLREFIENHPHDVDGKKGFWQLMFYFTLVGCLVILTSESGPQGPVPSMF